MHLDRQSVPHNLISAQKSPVPLPKFQMAPRLIILTSSGSKKGTQIHFLFFSQKPRQTTPSKYPNRAPMERDARLQGILHISRKRHKKSSKYEGLKKGAHLHVPPKAGSPVKELSVQVPFMESPVPRALLHSSFKVPSI